ncbi:MAG: RNA polymerase-binding protein DksA [Desulfatitalea sp.]|nr:RNA polymerase-binding protein DksA [Desulfatitalea sp.]NNK01734.1 RNA polymerase-binding protein DksA [Desulfatitalea sp.]
MSPEELAYFKEMLLQQLRELISNAGQTVGHLVQVSEWAADPLDQAAMETDRSNTLRIRDREYHLIRKVNEALTKIEDGTFGVCESCGEEITVARLKARPVTSYCIQCKIQMEAFEKASGF